MNFFATPTIFLFFALTIFYSDIKAQVIADTYKITGRVVDENYKPVGKATIILKNAQDSIAQVKGIIADENGKYFFENIAAGKYLIVISTTGQKTITKGPIELIATGPKEVNIEDVMLQSTSKILNEVTVVGKKPFIEQRIDKTILNIESSSLATGNSALELLQRAPGVFVDKDGNISLKGKAGASILIDGKLTYLSGDQLTSFLRSMQSTSVQTIELISNPSAKYDAAGASGIINIRLKKNSSYGLNGMVTVGAGYGKNYKANASTTLNYRTKNFNVFGDYNYDDNKLSRKLEIDRISPSVDANTYFNQETNAIMHSKNNTYKAGVDYYINEKNIIGIMFNGHANTGNDQTTNHTNIGNNDVNIDSTVKANNPTSKRFNYSAINLNYKSAIDTTGQDLNIDVDYAFYNNAVNNTYNNYFYDASDNEFKNPLIFRSNTPTKVKIFSTKIDYTYPFSSQIKLSAGIKTSYVKTDNNILFENLNNNDWQNDLTRSNQFQYVENINAAYASLEMKYKFAEVQLGLRGEQTNSKGNSITLQEIVKRNYFNLFPTLFIRKKLTENHSMGFSYSRRIDRPNYVTLNPFVYNFDLYTFSRGNPYLKPQFTNSFELSYVYGNKLYTTLGFSQTNDAITEVTLPNVSDKTLFVENQNLAKQQAYYLSISYPLTITDWWNVNNNLNISYNKFSTPNLLDLPFKSGRAAFDFNINQSFTVNSSSSVDMAVNYRSDRVYGTYFIRPIYSLDLGVKKTFAAKRMTAKLAANDLFNWHKERIRSVIPGQDYRIYQKFETQVFRLALSYRFGSDQIKSVRDRLKGSKTEENRVKN